MSFYDESRETVLGKLGVESPQGLSAAEAEQRGEKYGPNKLREKKKRTMFQRFLDQFKDVMILILIGAAAVSFVIAIMEGNAKEFFEPALILLIVILNPYLELCRKARRKRLWTRLNASPHPTQRL